MVNFTPLSAAIGGGLIGFSAVSLMLLTGRIAGISGIFAGLLDPKNDDKGWRFAFIAGLILNTSDCRLDRARNATTTDAGKLDRHHCGRPAGRFRHKAWVRLYLRPWDMRNSAAV